MTTHRRDKRNLGLAILFVSPCGLLYALERTSGANRTLLLIVSAGWVLAGGYNLISGRSFAEDVAPLLIVPLGIFTFARWLIFNIVAFFWWLVAGGKFVMGKKGRGNKKASIVPKAWADLAQDETVGRKLLSGRQAILGYNERRVVYSDLNSDRHLLITGVTGQGKTTVAWSILLSLLMPGPSALDKISFSIHDPKGVVGLHFRPLSDVYPDKFQVHTRLNHSYQAMEQLVDEMNNRTHHLGEKRVLEVDQLDPPLDHKLIILDEPQLWYRRNKKYEDRVLELVTAGRQAGFHFLMLVPYARSSIVNTEYRPNFRLISSRLPGHAKRVVGMDGITDLGLYEFLYQESEFEKPIFFHTYHITPADIAWVVGNALYSPTDAEEIGVFLFATLPGCGIRTLLREGVPHCQALIKSGRLKEIPFPWSEVSPNGGGEFRVSSQAWIWTKEFMRVLENAGIAGEAQHGMSRKVVVSDVGEALQRWKLYKEKKT